MAETKSWKRFLNEYIAENFVYAIRFVAMRQITKVEKSWWILWIGASLGACLFSIVSSYKKWDSNPVVILYASELMPVLTLPFPAITICPLAKYHAADLNVTWALEMADKNITMDEESAMKLRVLAHVCPASRHWKTFNESNEENVVPSLRAMALRLEKIMVHCRWRTTPIPCGNIMVERLKDDGICYTFNSLPLDEIYRTDQISPDFLNFPNATPPTDWTRDGGYRHGAGLNAYPKRPLSGGIISGLIMTAMVEKDDHEFMCQGAYNGFKLAVHAPDEDTPTEDRFFRLDMLSSVHLSVNPVVIKTSKNLRTLSPFKRNCYFSDERYLQFYKTYNQINCVVECVSNYTLEKCGCVKFSMPRVAGTKICDASKVNCYRYAFLELYDAVVRNQLAGDHRLKCNCMPTCTSIDYQVGMSLNPFNNDDLPIKLNFTTENADAAILFGFFKVRHYIPLLRRELVGVNQVIAELGGLFALLMGSSMMSLAEIFYYCCVRPLRRERAQEKPMVKPPRSRGHRIHLRVEPWAKHRHQTLGLYNDDSFI